MMKYLQVTLLTGLALIGGCTSARNLAQGDRQPSFQAAHEQPADSKAAIQQVNNEVPGTTPVVHLQEDAPAPSAWQKLKNWSSPNPSRIPLPRTEDAEPSADVSYDFHSF